MRRFVLTMLAVVILASNQASGQAGVHTAWGRHLGWGVGPGYHANGPRSPGGWTSHACGPGPIRHCCPAPVCGPVPMVGTAPVVGPAFERLPPTMVAKPTRPGAPWPRAVQGHGFAPISHGTPGNRPASWLQSVDQRQALAPAGYVAPPVNAGVTFRPTVPWNPLITPTGPVAADGGIRPGAPAAGNR